MTSCPAALLQDPRLLFFFSLPLLTCSVSFFSVGQSTSVLFIAFSKVTCVKITIIVMSGRDSEIKHSQIGQA